MNATREQLRENIIDLQAALRGELERYITACRPLLRMLRANEDRLHYLDWLSEGGRRDD